MKQKEFPGRKIICLNRKASFNYFFYDLIEAGIVLKGSEIKSIRAGKVNIAEAYAVEKDGEIFLLNSHIPAYKEASYSNHPVLQPARHVRFEGQFLPTAAMNEAACPARHWPDFQLAQTAPLIHHEDGPPRG